jgi:6-phosphofructokinase 1
MYPKKIGILVGGGPAPGINSVIGAATIRSALQGSEVIGLLDGFKWLMQGDISHTKELTIANVSRIHFRGGSYIGISRSNPTKDPNDLERVVTSLLRLNIDKLITIGGDDTAYSAHKVEQMASGRIRVVHVPKTIDNDLDLPHGIYTFGFQTARHIGVNIVKNLMVDAKTTSRWYFVVTMGRKAGHLALGIGKAAGATLTIIPEEFHEYNALSMKKLVDIVVGAIIKRLSNDRMDGVAVFAEGLVEKMSKEDLKNLVSVERDAHDNIRLAEISFGEILKKHVQDRLNGLNIKTTVVAKNIGYELRCADPIPFDMEYTRDLGYCAAKFIHNGGNAAMVSIRDGRFVPLYFKEIMDEKTGRTKVRMVDIDSEYYHIARRYMIRLSPADFDDAHELAKYAATAGISLKEFEKQFRYVAELSQALSPANALLAKDDSANGRKKPVKKAETTAKDA